MWLNYGAGAQNLHVLPIILESIGYWPSSVLCTREVEPVVSTRSLLLKEYGDIWVVWLPKCHFLPTGNTFGAFLPMSKERVGEGHLVLDQKK